VVNGARLADSVYVYANLLGCEAGRAIYDGDTLIASGGEIVARGERFSYADFSLITAYVDIEINRSQRTNKGTYSVEAHSEKNIVKTSLDITFTAATSSPCEKRRVPWEESTDIKSEEFWKAVSLGLFDYMRKSRSSGFVVSLSGGVDSTAASCLVMLMVKEAVRQLGFTEVVKKLGHISWIGKVSDEASLLRELLTCVYQGTTNSSDVTRNAARSVASSLGATFYELNISELVTGYERLIGQAIGVDITWSNHDIAKQNIQARVRSPSVWLLANLRGALLLSTGNRSEASVGYTTMDGDSSGGLSPLGGIDKAFLREWMVWLERTGPIGMRVAMPVLSLVNQQAPTAELRPLERAQTDEGDLMPYVVLDRIERYAVRDKKSPLEVRTIISKEYEGRYDPSDLLRWTERFFVLWSQNQWKRERLAPSFHLDDESVDPKTWCRFPILSGGYRLELQRMRDEAK
jgi:NAD+ synthase (glutamine-hydrolysing)